MSETKNVVIQQNNGIDYDILKPERSINDKLFGYWWKKEHIVVTKQYLGGNYTNLINLGSYTASYANNITWNFSVNYGDSYIIDKNSLFIKDAKSESVTVVSTKSGNHTSNNNTPNLSDRGEFYWGIQGKIIACFSNKEGEGDPLRIGVIGMLDFNSNGSGGTSYLYGTNQVNGYFFVLTTNVESIGYVFSSNRNKYPDNGQLENDYYTFLGVPFSNALLLSKSDIQV